MGATNAFPSPLKNRTTRVYNTHPVASAISASCTHSLTHSLPVLSSYTNALQHLGYLSIAGPSRGDTVLLLSARFEKRSLHHLRNLLGFGIHLELHTHPILVDGQIR